MPFGSTALYEFEEHIYIKLLITIRYLEKLLFGLLVVSWSLALSNTFYYASCVAILGSSVGTVAERGRWDVGPTSWWRWDWWEVRSPNRVGGWPQNLMGDERLCVSNYCHIAILVVLYKCCCNDVASQIYYCDCSTCRESCSIQQAVWRCHVHRESAEVTKWKDPSSVSER